MRADIGELLSEIRTAAEPHRALGTANWMAAPVVREQLALPTDKASAAVWLGENLDAAATPIGYDDDRHIMLVSGTRGGKGAGVIVPNLCRWPGSAIVIDPKGENAQVTARRRGAGSDYARGMGQKVCVLDPFGEVDIAGVAKARFNPLDIINPESDLAVDDAGRVAAAIVPDDHKGDPFWVNAPRALLKGVILHVLSDKSFAGRRNLITVFQLLTEGDTAAVARDAKRAALKRTRDAANGVPPKPDNAKPISPHSMLWMLMRRNRAFGGAVAAAASSLLAMAEKTRASVLSIASTNTDFAGSLPMRRMLEASDFSLAELKTNPRGLTLYLVLPQRFMPDHFRWLRLMTALAVGEMEHQKGRPETGHRTLFLLDEFAGLKRMPVIEHAVAQAAGFGVKFLFVLQNLAQLKSVYEDAWETFVSNSGTRIFFQIDDQFTREYLSKQLGEQEVRRETRSVSEAQTASQSTTAGKNDSVGRGSSLSHAENESVGRSLSDWELQGHNRGRNRGDTEGTNDSETAGTSFSQSGSVSASTTDTRSEGAHKRPLLHPDEIGRFLSRIDNANHPGYPGLIACMVPGQQPLLLRRVNYFSASRFAGLFDPHPQHPLPPTLLEREQQKLPAAENPQPKPVAAAQPVKTVPPKPVRPPDPPPHVTVPVTPVTDLMQKLMAQTRSTPVLPPPPAPPLPHPKTILPVAPQRRFSAGEVILPALILGTVVLAILIWVGAHLSSPTSASSWSAGHSAAFKSGYAARQNWEAWMARQSGEAQEGAAFWAGERSKRSPGSCQDGTGQYSEAYRNACHEAQRALGAADQLRQRDPEYRAGWNSY